MIFKQEDDAMKWILNVFIEGFALVFALATIVFAVCGVILIGNAIYEFFGSIVFNTLLFCVLIFVVGLVSRAVKYFCGN